MGRKSKFSKEQKIQSNAKKIDKFIRKNDILQLTAQSLRTLFVLKTKPVWTLWQ